MCWLLRAGLGIPGACRHPMSAVGQGAQVPAAPGLWWCKTAGARQQEPNPHGSQKPFNHVLVPWDVG